MGSEPDQAPVAMVSGASGGIGGAIARSLHQSGYRLSLGIRTPRPVAGLDSAGAEVKTFSYDATRAEDARVWVNDTVRHFGRIDVLVNCAGIIRTVTLEEGSEEDLEALFEVNVKAPYRLIRAALPELKKCGRGRVINMASLSGKRVRNLNAGYQMSKFALVALTHAVRRAGWEDGVRATAICPGWVRTEMAARAASMPPEEMTDADELAALVTSVIGLSNNASVAELLVNCSFETML
ncbi:MAG: SDR family NAD(P)-dependent oxidoreductase [Betaproteobacteria bacterium]|nr:SDR family NAD(P)-dependent oxidoreductase [Betaproteobacteria bacterium]